MTYFKNGEHHISNVKVHYKDVDEGEITKYVGSEGKQWWIDFAENWKETFELIEFIEVEVTKEQIDRLEKVNELGLKEGVFGVSEYVEEENFDDIERNNPLYVLKLEKIQTELAMELANSNYENLMLNFDSKNSLELEQANSNLESLMMITDLKNRIETLENKGE